MDTTDTILAICGVATMLVGCICCIGATFHQTRVPDFEEILVDSNPTHK